MRRIHIRTQHSWCVLEELLGVDDLSMNGTCEHSTVFDDYRYFTRGKYTSQSSSLHARSLTRFAHCCPLTLANVAASLTAVKGFASLFTMLVPISFCIETGFLLTSFGGLRSHAGLCRRHLSVQLLQDSHVGACRSSTRPQTFWNPVSPSF